MEVQASRCVDFGGMAVTLVGAAGSGDEFTRLTALKWLRVRRRAERTLTWL